MTPDIPLLEARSLSLRYGTREVLSDFSCTIDQGELLGISGPNGCGKTTLLKALLGIHRPASGKILRHTLAKNPGYVPQHAPIDKNFPLTASEYLAIHCQSRIPWIGGIPRKLRHGICGKLDCLGISHLANRQLGALSGGELQRVRIAAALLDEPKLLMLDEPSSHLDSAATGSLKQLLLHLHKEHSLTLLVVSHDTAFLKGLTTRCIDLRAIAEICSPSPSWETSASPLTTSAL
ncbi:MAG: ATP-binding cassette domain-containing protein [Verrucomicrobia bacterium]|nr:ATP-binding cassette domain-containing protein [Verrucomicrobiota bacterium]